MQGKIELHGAKQMFISTDSTIELKSPVYIPGDDVLLNPDLSSTLLYRRPQAIIGITKVSAKGTSLLYVPTFGQTCKFMPAIDIESPIGTKFVLWLLSDGTFRVEGRYSSTAEDDAKALIHMYELSPTRDAPLTQKSGHLYTSNNVVNHEDLDTFTIDPTHSVDFDDALSVDVATNTVYIHIVDIAAYEHLHPNLWTRCLSLYLANEHTSHLLDAEDASHRLSLVTGCPRAVITVKVQLEAGLVVKYEIYKSIIVVKRRWNYDEVSTALQTGAPESILYLAQLTKARSSTINYNINLPSVRIHADKGGRVISLHTENTNDESHSLVATAMILGNLVVSKHLAEKGIVIPNRFHDTLRGFNAQNFHTTQNEFVDSFIIVKRYARAYYSLDERGHFGLGLKEYVHFTSPMRRYADVLVHRLLAGHAYSDLDAEVNWLNHRSCVVRSIQDLYIKWKSIRWLRQLPGPHEIWVSGVSKAGILWFMPSLSLNGFLHISELKPVQYWKFDGEMLIGTKSGHTISLGLKLLAHVASIDEVTNTVSLKLHDPVFYT